MLKLDNGLMIDKWTNHLPLRQACYITWYFPCTFKFTSEFFEDRCVDCFLLCFQFIAVNLEVLLDVLYYCVNVVRNTILLCVHFVWNIIILLCKLCVKHYSLYLYQCLSMSRKLNFKQAKWFSYRFVVANVPNNILQIYRHGHVWWIGPNCCDTWFTMLDSWHSSNDLRDPGCAHVITRVSTTRDMTYYYITF